MWCIGLVLRLGEVVNEAMDMVWEFLESDRVDMLLYHDYNTQRVIFRSPPGGVKVYDRVVLDMLRDWLITVMGDWSVRPGYIDEYRMVHRVMSGGEFLEWVGKAKVSAREDMLGMVKRNSRVEWYKVIVFNDRDESIIYYDEFIIWNKPRPRKTIWRPRRLAAGLVASISLAALIDYLAVTRGLLLIPPLGFNLHPGFGLLNMLEAGGLSVLILTIGLWLGGLSPRSTALMLVSSLSALFFLSLIVFGVALLSGAVAQLIIAVVTALLTSMVIYEAARFVEKYS